MSKYYYNLYCDESGINKSVFHFEDLHCSRERAVIFDKEIQEFRARTNLTGELKWTKVSKTMLPAYREFTDIFLDDVYTTFILSEIIRDTHWRRLASSSDSQFLHAYFHFVEQVMWASARYAIFLDDMSSRRYKFESFHYALNLPDITRRKQKKVHTFRLIDSCQHNVMQLVDVILGALVSEATALHKVALSDHVKEKIARDTKHGRPKLITHNWTAPENRRFEPNL